MCTHGHYSDMLYLTWSCFVCWPALCLLSDMHMSHPSAVGMCDQRESRKMVFLPSSLSAIMRSACSHQMQCMTACKPLCVHPSEQPTTFFCFPASVLKRKGEVVKANDEIGQSNTVRSVFSQMFGARLPFWRAWETSISYRSRTNHMS